MGVAGCSTGVSASIVGWHATALAGRLALAVEKSAEVVVPAGSVFAGKDQTRRRVLGRSCSWPLR
jgi:hypothetical protein